MTVSFTILKSEYEEAKNFCEANFEIPKEYENEFIGSELLWLAHQELWLEKQDIKVRKKFGTVQYPKLFPISDCYIIKASVSLKMYQKMLEELQQSYPKIIDDDSKSVTAFLAHLGYVFVKHAEKGQVDPGIMIAAKNINKIEGKRYIDTKR